MSPTFRFKKTALFVSCQLLSWLTAFSVTGVCASQVLAEETGNGSAADLGDFPPVGWPLGTPLKCQAMSDAVNKLLLESALKLRDYCNEQNEKMHAAGYKSCARNQCLDSAVTRDNGYDYGKFVLRLYRSLYTGEPVLTLTYSYPGNVQPNGTFPVCFDPLSRSRELLEDEFAAWDFNRFVEFCVVPAGQR